MSRTLLIISLSIVTVFFAVAFFIRPSFSEPEIGDLDEIGFLQGDTSAELDDFIDKADSLLEKGDVGTSGLSHQENTFWTWNVPELPSFSLDGEEVDPGISVWTWKGEFYVSVQYGPTILLAKQKTRFGLRRAFYKGLKHLQSIDGVRSRSETQLMIDPASQFSPDAQEGEWIEVKRGIDALPSPKDADSE